MRRLFALGLFLFFLRTALCNEEVSLPATFKPDPATVQRVGPAFRYPQAGWIVLHIEGEPYERGVQHGKLLSPEIARHLRCMAEHRSSKNPTEAWSDTRTLVNSVFLRRFEKEYLEEMQGIADGASAAGARFGGRPIDLVDIAALNVWAELMTLDGALAATPTGLEGIRFPEAPAKPGRGRHGEHCSAFAATGPATTDGKVVFGHITMYELYPSSFFNVWIDVLPAKGNRVVMQSYPGGMQSGLDYYMNSAGLLVTETTIAQTRFDVEGQSLSSQIRKAVQYSDSIDSFVAAMQHGNGLYTNEWLLADIKTNEIAMFELGTKTSKLYRSSKNEWFGGTEGFYWGCNNVKDMDVRLETIASVNERPENMVYRPHDRDILWVQMYRKYKGHIDANFGKEALTTPPLASYTSVDAKVTTTDAAKNLSSWALYGPPLGRTWLPNPWERERFPAIEPMVSNPWTILNVLPMPAKSSEPLAVDLGGKRRSDGGAAPFMRSGWHGTILPKTDGDIWLAASFAEYERFFTREHSRAAAARDIFSQRINYLYGVRNGADVPLWDIKTSPDNGNWYRIAAGKGFLVLHELRAQLGDKVFAEIMDSFGTQYAGKEVSSGDFVAHVIKESKKDLKPFFEYWLTKPGLPVVKLVSANAHAIGHPVSVGAGTPMPIYEIKAVIKVESGPMPMLLDVTLEMEKGEITNTVIPNPETGSIYLTSQEEPKRIVVNKYARSALANGALYGVGTYHSDLEHTLIVYGTDDEVAANKDGAAELQQSLIKHGSNITVPIRTDRNVTDEELRTHHVLLIGRPECNRVSREFASAFPVVFGAKSFKIGRDSDPEGERYAHAGSAVVAATANPREPRYSVVMIAGLSAASTYATAAGFAHAEGGEVTVFENGGRVQSYVLPAAELQRDFVTDGK